MSDQNDVYLAAGKIVVFSTGEYSDYGYRGMYVTLRPLLRSRLREIADETEAEWKEIDAAQDAWTPESGKPYPQGVSVHEIWETNLIKDGLLMVIDYDEMHVGGYSELVLGI